MHKTCLKDLKKEEEEEAEEEEEKKKKAVVAPTSTFWGSKGVGVRKMFMREKWEKCVEARKN